MDIEHQKKLGTKDNWWFQAKNELVKSFIEGESLNIGGGLTDIGDIILDNDKTILKLNPKAQHGNAYGLPFSEGAFDTVIASDVLEHLKFDSLAVREMYNVLKKGGIAIITVPAYMFLFSEHDEILGHYRRYDKEEIEDLFTEQGFKIRKLSYWNFFLFPGVVLVKLFSKGLNLGPTNKLINKLLSTFLRIENFLLRKGISFPFGGTVFGVFEK